MKNEDAMRTYTRRTISEKFWSKVSKPDDPIGDECWEWTGMLHESGYGLLWTRHSDDRLKLELAHRISFRLDRGSLREEDCVLHKCDNRKCVRPDHLFSGDRNDNAKDAFRKGRTARAEMLPHTKLSREDVACVRRHLSSGISQRRVARFLGVSRGAIDAIHRGKSWRHVA